MRCMNTPPKMVPAESEIMYCTRLSTLSLLMNRKNAPIAERIDVSVSAVPMLIKLLINQKKSY